MSSIASTERKNLTRSVSITLPSPQLQCLFAVGVIVVGMVVCLPYAAGYADFRKTLFHSLTEQWFSSEGSTWQHGVLAPFIAGYLVWLQRAKAMSLPVKPNNWGLAFILFSLFSYYVGYRANNYYFGAFGVQLLICSMVVWMLGWAHLRLHAFAWIILGFSWPLRFLEDTLGFQLQLLMVRTVSVVLTLVGAPIIRQGTSLVSVDRVSGNVGEWLRLDIDGPCSGMRSLFALMLVTALMSWFRQPTLLRRVLLFTTSVPLAVFANVIRIFLLIIGSLFLGQSWAVGDHQQEVSAFHFVSGIVVFVVAAGCMELISNLMNRLWPRARKQLGSKIST